MITTYHKVPNARLDHLFNFDDYLQVGETIVSFDVSIDETWPAAMTPALVIEDGSGDVPAPALNATSRGVLAWFSAGTVAQRKYRVTCQITTSSERIDERTIIIGMRDVL